MSDPDLEISGWDGGGGGGGRGGHPKPEVTGGTGIQKTFFCPSGLSLV